MKGFSRAPHMALLILLTLKIVAQAQVSKDHQASCKAAKSPVAEAYCKILDDEFARAKFATGSYPANGVLRNPMVESPVFAAAVFRKAYLNVAKGALTADAKSVAIFAIQTEANQLAQALSTKAAVPQTGANVKSSGSTSLVSKPTTTDLISLVAVARSFHGHSERQYYDGTSECEWSSSVSSR